MIRAAALPVVTLAVTGWALASNPLAAPFVERGVSDLALTLERQVQHKASAAWITAALAEAVAAGDAERTVMLLDLADELGRDVPRTEAEALVTAQSGTLAQIGDCGACMLEPAQCASATMLAACAVPFELSPAGDLNALRRAGRDWIAGDDVDELDAGLALIGLGATGAVLVSGGSSASVKAGTGLLRLARRMGTLSSPLTRAARLAVRGDADALARLGRTAAELDRVRAATSVSDTLRLMRHVDGPEDAARLARVAEAAGPRTARSFAVLGPARVFRATTRLSRMAAGTLALIWLSVLQLGTMAAGYGGTRLTRAALVDSAR